VGTALPDSVSPRSLLGLGLLLGEVATPGVGNSFRAPIVDAAEQRLLYCNADGKPRYFGAFNGTQRIQTAGYERLER